MSKYIKILSIISELNETKLDIRQSTLLKLLFDTVKELELENELLKTKEVEHGQ